MCNPTATTPDCAGLCISFTGSSATLCSQGCVLGGDLTTSPNCGGIDAGVCLYAPAGNGAGDYGLCSTACAKQDDCQNPAFWCAPIGVGGVTNGYCSPPTPCPKGASDCSSDAMSTCTETKYGPFCLHSQFPLGSAAPADGGTDGGETDGGTEAGENDGGAEAGESDGGAEAGESDGGAEAGESDGGAEAGESDGGAEAGEADAGGGDAGGDDAGGDDAGGDDAGDGG